MSDFGIKVSLPGIDVLTATPEQCVIHSGYPSPKIKMDSDPVHFGTLRFTFETDLTKSTDVLLKTIEHGYDYIPWVVGSISLDSTNGGILESLSPLAPAGTLYIWMEVDDSEVRLYAHDAFNWISASDTMDVSYYIFAEEVETA